MAWCLVKNGYNFMAWYLVKTGTNFTLNFNFGFHKGREVSWTAKRPPVSEDEIYIIELITSSSICFSVLTLFTAMSDTVHENESLTGHDVAY
jgi:hypothetical protein